MEIKPIVVGQLGANCYLVIDQSTREAAVIDPGDEPDVIARVIEDNDALLKHILLTHGHSDHSFAAGELQQKFPGVKLLMHELDLPQLHDETGLVELFYDVSRYIEPTLGEFLNHGDVIALGETELRVIHTPGHTPGGVCFVSGKTCFTGDTLFEGSIGRTDFMGGSAETLLESIHDRLLTLPDDTVIYPGHGPSSTIGAERRMNPWIRG